MRALAISALLSIASLACAEGAWKTVDEGFRVTVPESWNKISHCIDGPGDCGTYRGGTTELEFHARCAIPSIPEYEKEFVSDLIALAANLTKKEANPKLLGSKEEIWHIGDRIADFQVKKVDPLRFGKRGFVGHAELQIPDTGSSCLLSIDIIYRNHKELPAARRILQSINWDPLRQAISEEGGEAGRDLDPLPLTTRIVELGKDSQRTELSGAFRGKAVSLAVSTRKTRVVKIAGAVDGHRFVVDKGLFKTVADLHFDKVKVLGINYAGVTSFVWSLPFGNLKTCWRNTNQGREEVNDFRDMNLTLTSDGDLYQSGVYDPTNNCSD